MRTLPNARLTRPDIAAWLRDRPTEQRSDCERLLCQQLQCSRATLHSDPGRILSSAELAALNTQAQRLENHEPLAYLLGEQPFHNILLNVDPRVLVPRSDTETLVEAALAHARLRGEHLSVLDLGTGSGAIAIALAVAMPALRITATDASADALQVAKENAARWQSPIELQQSHWLRNVSGPFDLVVSNPPYIAADDLHLPALAHEPASALVAGADGLTDLREIIAAAPTHLNPDGTLMVEHGFDQADAVWSLFHNAGFVDVECIHDLGNRPRVTTGQWQPTL